MLVLVLVLVCVLGLTLVLVFNFPLLVALLFINSRFGAFSGKLIVPVTSGTFSQPPYSGPMSYTLPTQKSFSTNKVSYAGLVLAVATLWLKTHFALAMRNTFSTNQGGLL